MAEIVGTLFGGEAWQERADGAFYAGYGARGSLAHHSFEFAEGHFDRIEVGRIFGQIAKARPSGFDGFTDAGNLVESNIVNHGDIAAPERWNEALFDIGQEHLPVHGSFDCHRGDHFVVAQSGDKGDCLPSPEWSPSDQLDAAWTAPPEPDHLGGDGSLVNKHQAARIKQPLLANPSPAGAGHVRPLLFRRPQILFF